MNNLIIRKATLSDLNEIQQLFADTIKSTCKNDYTKEQIAVWVSSIENKERWKTKLMNQYFLIVEIKKDKVGFGSLENGNHLDFMYVHKDYLRKGIANRLYQELEKEAKESGANKITSDVSITAKPFFEHKGFNVIKENKNIIKGIEIINYKMEKILRGTSKN